MIFRKDINALRAVAVALVVLFHFSLLGLSGGYIGVDIFFVISGFLMTALICKNMPNDFSILGFYAARLRRIFPALFLLCLVLLGLGWFFVPPADYATLASHSASSVGFFSNFLYKDEAGYFDSPSQFKWLLHTWSLSVEWQFYLIYPLFMAMFYKFLPHRVFTFLVVLTLLSLGASIYFSYTKPEFAFFYLFTRIWEMTAGGVAWFIGQKKIHLYQIKPIYVEAMALSAIILAAFVFSANTMWPSFFALVPVLATVSILLYSMQSNSKWIVSAPVQALGLWSYSIYLWHWPIVVALGYWTQDVPIWAKAVGVLASVFAGFLSYRFIELPSKRQLSRLSHNKVIFLSLFMMALFVGVCGFISSQKGFPKRFDDNLRLQLAEAGAIRKDNFRDENNRRVCGYWPNRDELKPCILGNKDDLSYIVLGDSHAASVAGAIVQAFGNQKGGHLYTHQCATIFNAELRSKGKDNNCTEFHQQVLKKIEQSPTDTIIIVANRYSATIKGPNEATNTQFGVIYNDQALNKLEPQIVYQQELSKSLCRLQSLRKTYAFKPIPEMGISVPEFLARRALLNIQEQDVMYPMRTYTERHQAAIKSLRKARETCDVRLIDPLPVLCDNLHCYGSKAGVPYYRDDDHLNEAGRKMLMPVLNKLFND
jgi:peptidoglycan/LPS O-acetylase OafA/YrhL